MLPDRGGRRHRHVELDAVLPRVARSGDEPGLPVVGLRFDREPGDRTELADPRPRVRALPRDHRPGRGHVLDRALPSPESGGGIPNSEITLAEALKERGYKTACVGKWHLGHLKQFLPTENGFDEYFGIPYSNDMNPNPAARKGATRRLDQQAEWWNAPLSRGTELAAVAG